jgi:hypothetical protein
MLLVFGVRTHGLPLLLDPLFADWKAPIIYDTSITRDAIDLQQR